MNRRIVIHIDDFTEKVNNTDGVIQNTDRIGIKRQYDTIGRKRAVFTEVNFDASAQTFGFAELIESFEFHNTSPGQIIT